MLNMNEIITRNIMAEMQKISKKQVELAADLNISKQTMSKMLSGDRMINAVELAAIARALNVSTDKLVQLPINRNEENAVRAFMGKVNTLEAKEGLEIADKLADLICFHTRCRENGESMNVSWKE